MTKDEFESWKNSKVGTIFFNFLKYQRAMIFTTALYGDIDYSDSKLIGLLGEARGGVHTYDNLLRVDEEKLNGYTESGKSV